MKTKQKYSRHQVVAAAVLLLPTAVCVLGFSYYPAIRAIIGSFTRWNGFSEPVFIGFGNYITLFTDRIFLISLRNVFVWSAMSLCVGMVAPLIGAELVFNLPGKRSQYVYRVLFVLPMVVPSVVTLLIWTFIYDPNIGMLNRLLVEVFGIAREAIPNWLGNPRLVLFALTFIGFPWMAGLNLLIYYSGLQDISTDVIEYAQLDGCTGFRRIFRIDLPLIMGQIKLLFVLGIIGTLQNITVPLLMTEGGPGYSSYVPGYYMYFKAFRMSDFGMAFTVATSMFIMIFILTIFSRRISTGSSQ